MNKPATDARPLPSLATVTHLSRAAFIGAVAALVVLAAMSVWQARRFDSELAGPLTLTAGLALTFLAAAWLLSRRAVVRLDRAQVAARLGEARLHATLQSCGDALIVTDKHGKVTLLNPAAEILTGWSQSAAEGLSLEQVFRIVSESTREPLESPAGPVLRDGTVVGLSDPMLLIARDGTERPIEDSAAPIRGADTAGVVLVFRDVTARRLSEQARERLLRAEAAREAAVRANEAKDQFLALVSHELRSPLAAIRGWLHLLDGGFVRQAELRGALERISRNTRLQERLVSDLLDISRITAGKLEVMRAPVDLVKVVQIAVDGCVSLAQQKGVAVVLEKHEARIIVLGDEQRLVQSIANLAGNGIKFTPPGGSVLVRVERGDHHAVVTVADDGIGVSPEVIGRLFERFWQADSSKAREHGGLGLGLAITKHLIDEHGGTIDAASAGAGSGSTFTIRLPALDVDSVGEEVPAPSERDSKDLTGMHVLLVDDDRDARDATQILLEARGAKVSAAGSVKGAIRSYEAEPPSVVVSDIGMPDVDGYALAGEIRERDALAGTRTPMIALTGYAGTSDFREALQRGFDAHLAKPVDPDNLAVQIAALVRKPRRE
jgi:PAS domain S-box-containing protein